MGSNKAAEILNNLVKIHFGVKLCPVANAGMTHKSYSRESGKWTFIRLGFKWEGRALVFFVQILPLTVTACLFLPGV